MRHAYTRALDGPQTLHPREAAAAGLDVRDSVTTLEAKIGAHGLWSGLVRHFWKRALLYLLFGTGVIVAGPAMPWAIETTMSRMDTGGSGLIIAAALLSLATLTYTLLRWASTWQVRMLVYRIDLSVQRIIFRRLQRTDPRWLAQQKKSSSSFLLEYPQQLSQIAFAVEFVVYTVLMCVLVGCLIAWYGLAGVAVLVTIVAGTMLSKWMIDRSTKATKTYVDGDHARAGLVDALVSAWEPIRRQHLENVLAASFDRVRGDQERYLERRALRSAWTRSVTSVLPVAAVWAAMAVGVFVGTGLNAGQGIALLVLVRLLMTVVSENLATYATLRFGWSMGADVSALLSDAPTVDDMHDPHMPLGAVTVESRAGQQLAFAPGERVAIVSRDSADATALLQRIAGVPGVKTDWTARHGGVAASVSRNQPTFDGSFADIVTLWNNPPRDAYVRAQSASGLLADLGGRPGGDSATLSSTSQRISDGQNVRIGLAQALVTDPNVLLLDDVFAPLDPQVAQNVAHRMLAPGGGTTRLFSTTRIELAAHADTLLLVDGDSWRVVDPADAARRRDDIADFVGAALADSLAAAVTRERDHELDATEAPAALHYSPSDAYVPPPAEAHEAKVNPARPADLFRNVRGLFPMWAIAVIPVLAVVLIGMEYALAGFLDRGVETAQTVWLMAGFTVLLGTIAWGQGYLELRTPMSAIARIHTGLVEGLLSGRTDSRHSSAAGRLSRDFFSLELRIPSQLSGFATAWLTVGVATATVAATGWVTLIPLALLAASGIWAYRKGRVALIAAVQLSASCRGPLLNFGRDALGTHTFHTSVALRRALSARFDDLGAIRGVGMLRMSWVQLRTLLTVELLGLGFFLTTLWALVFVPGAPALAAGVIVYAAYTFSQQVARLVENMQGMDTTLLMLGRIADSLGAPTLPTRAHARRTIPDSTGAMAAALLRSQDRDETHRPILHTRKLRLRMPDGIDTPRPVDLSLDAGSFTVLSGRSGVGKSTLLRTVAGARPRRSGKIHLAQYVPDVLGRQTRDNCRYIESDLPGLPVPVSALMETASSRALPLLDELTSALGLSRIDHEKPVAELDHARRQLVNLARGFANRPAVVFCDEATSALDTVSERDVYRRLRDFAPDTAILAVLHRVDNQDLADLKIDVVGSDGPSYSVS